MPRPWVRAGRYTRQGGGPVLDRARRRGGERVGEYVVISSPEMYTILGATIFALSELIALAPSLLAAPATAAPAAVVPRHRADTWPAPEKRGVIAARVPLRRSIPARDTIARVRSIPPRGVSAFYKSFNIECSNLTILFFTIRDFRGGGFPASFPGAFSLCAWPSL